MNKYFKRAPVLMALLVAVAARAEATAETVFLPSNNSHYGAKIDDLYYYLLGATVVAFSAVLLSLMYFCIRYRWREGKKAYYTHGDTWGATGVSVALAMVVFTGIDMNTVRLSNAAAKETQAYPTGENVRHIQVLAQQFSWQFRYPGPDGKFGRADLKSANPDNPFGLDLNDPENKDDLQIEGLCCIPVGQPIVFDIRAKDVIHSFFLPNYRIKQDAVPGMKTNLWFVPIKKGIHEIACAELCGMMHSQMKATLLVREQDEFEKWVAEKKADQ